MVKEFKPSAPQQIMLEHMLRYRRCAVWGSMGLGKTSVTLAALSIIDLYDSGPTLVVAPRRVALSTWPDEARKWDFDIEVSAIVGNPQQRRLALRKPANVYTTNYEQIPWLVNHFGNKWPFRKIVPDESTKLKGFRLRQGTLRSRTLARVAFETKSRFIELSGLPAPNGLKDLWGQLFFLDKGHRLGTSFDAFSARWFDTVRTGTDAFETKLVPRPGANEEILSRVSDICVSIDAKEFFDIKDPIVVPRFFELPDKARKLYDKLENELFAELDSGALLEAFNASSKTMKCLQVACGAIYINKERTTFDELHDVKIQILDEIIEEAAGMPVLVAYHFKHDLIRLREAFPQGRVLDANPQTIADWNAGEIPILFAHPASCGHGLNLQDGGNILAVFAHWWNYEDYAQIVERIGPTRQMQAGHDRPVFIYHIVAKDTVEETIVDCRNNKGRLHDFLVKYMKEKRKCRLSIGR